MRYDDRLLKDAQWAKENGYAPFWVKGVIAAKLRGEEVEAERLAEADKIMGAVIRLKKFQRAGGESYYCPRSKDFSPITTRYMDAVVNGRSTRGVSPDLSVPKTRALFLKGLQEVENRWTAEYAAQEGTSLQAPKAHGNRNRGNNRNRRRATA
jgi:hypothetical protein